MPEHSSASEVRNRKLAEAVRSACLRAALDAYEDASMRGLCHDGAWECAVGAIRAIDLDTVLDAQKERELPG